MAAEVEACCSATLYGLVGLDPLSFGVLLTTWTPVLVRRKMGRWNGWRESKSEREQEVVTQGHRQSRLLLRESLPEAAAAAAAASILL